MLYNIFIKYILSKKHTLGNNTGNGMLSIKCTTDGFFPDIFTDIITWCALVRQLLFVLVRLLATILQECHDSPRALRWRFSCLICMDKLDLLKPGESGWLGTRNSNAMIQFIVSMISCSNSINICIFNP